MSKLKILITGANGFIGKNLCVHLIESGKYDILKFQRNNTDEELALMASQALVIIHLAGENRPKDCTQYEVGNVKLVHKLANIIAQSGNKAPIIFTSSTQVERDGEYGKSKLKAEAIFKDLASKNGNPVAIYRLPNVFGKWAKPNYNSVVATFCSNIANDLPIQINDPEALISLLYIDDLIASFIDYIRSAKGGVSNVQAYPIYRITVGELAKKIYKYKQSRVNLTTEAVGIGLDRALYATFMSYYRPMQFVYEFAIHSDERGIFAEILKTANSGQISFFTIKPGKARGGHYHHTKSEKFIILRGSAKFSFYHLLTHESCEIKVSHERPCVVDTIPGWVHDIVNIGNEELIAILWANEIFDQEFSDTFRLSF